MASERTQRLRVRHAAIFLTRGTTFPFRTRVAFFFFSYLDVLWDVNEFVPGTNRAVPAYRYSFPLVPPTTKPCFLLFVMYLCQDMRKKIETSCCEGSARVKSNYTVYCFCYVEATTWVHGGRFKFAALCFPRCLRAGDIKHPDSFLCEENVCTPTKLRVAFELARYGRSKSVGALIGSLSRA